MRSPVRMSAARLAGGKSWKNWMSCMQRCVSGMKRGARAKKHPHEKARMMRICTARMAILCTTPCPFTCRIMRSRALARIIRRLLGEGVRRERVRKVQVWVAVRGARGRRSVRAVVAGMAMRPGGVGRRALGAMEATGEVTAEMEGGVVGVAGDYSDSI